MAVKVKQRNSANREFLYVAIEFFLPRKLRQNHSTRLIDLKEVTYAGAKIRPGNQIPLELVLSHVTVSQSV